MDLIDRTISVLGATLLPAGMTIGWARKRSLKTHVIKLEQNMNKKFDEQNKKFDEMYKLIIQISK